MKITKSKPYLHCCDCGSMSEEFDDMQHIRYCKEIKEKMQWEECLICKNKEIRKQISKKRFVIIEKELKGVCNDIYCDGHFESFLIDTKTNKQKRIHPPENYVAIIEVLNWLEE